MGKRIRIFLILAVGLLFPHVASADCVDLGNYTNWYLEDSHRVIFYQGEVPLARLTIPDCEIHRFSHILLLKSYVCDSDNILIDGQKCSIMTVKSMD
jgi:hypothetical protein